MLILEKYRISLVRNYVKLFSEINQRFQKIQYIFQSIRNIFSEFIGSKKNLLLSAKILKEFADC